MKTQFQRKKDIDFENEQHISRKKKAAARQTQVKTVKDRNLAFNLDDPDDVLVYEKYLK